MILKKSIPFILLFFGLFGFSQQIELSPIAKMSLLTIGTADELHSKFGHTAIRIQDTSRGMDIVFGYGGFDFKDPLFYSKFTTGKLDYYMTGNQYPDFLAGYKIENRWVKEQELNLSVVQRNALFKFLQNNYQEENRYYKYDFLFDNCATKIPEVFEEVFGTSLRFDFGHLKKESTFRQLIHEHLVANSWATFGIDLALGSVIDRKATPWEHQFLPLYVEKQFENIMIDGKPLVKDEQLLLDASPAAQHNNFLLSPLFWLIVLMLAVALITHFDKKNDTRTRWLDFALFFATGIAGLLICFLWFGTNHSSTKLNFNFLWAFPVNVGVAFMMLKKKPLPLGIKKYLWFVLPFLLLTLILWALKIQVFSPLIIPILIALTIRYLFLITRFNTSTPSQKN